MHYVLCRLVSCHPKACFMYAQQLKWIVSPKINITYIIFSRMSVRMLGKKFTCIIHSSLKNQGVDLITQEEGLSNQWKQKYSYITTYMGTRRVHWKSLGERWKKLFDNHIVHTDSGDWEKLCLVVLGIASHFDSFSRHKCTYETTLKFCSFSLPFHYLSKLKTMKI